MSQNRFHTIGLIPVLSLLFLAGCSKDQGPQTAENLASDPASANLAPVDGSVQPAQPTAVQPPVPAQTQYPPSPPPPAYNASNGNYAAQANYSANDASYDSGYGQQTIEAPQPPPPLPEYTQPECPGDDYIWTPGYWSYTAAGYYWVPGAWVVAPYVGSLWTPPYWEHYGGRYRFHHGYWGLHVGFYGAINYGFGYTGRGYEGGYWHDRTFEYNRTVNNVNISRVRNVYNYNVVNYTTVNRISYNGGPGGIQVRATAPELAAQREARTPPVAAQVEHMRQAADNRAQFANVNHGHPQTVAAAAPLPTAYRAPAARPPAAVERTPASAPQPNQPVNQPPFNRPEMRSGADMRVQIRNAPESHPAPAPPQQPVRQQPIEPAHNNQPAQVFRPAPENRPAQPQPMAARPVPNEPAHSQPAQVFRPQPENRPAPQVQPRARPQFQARPAESPRAVPPPETRPAMRAPEPPPQARPQPQAQPQPRAVEPPRPAPPAPQGRPNPEPARPGDRKDERR